MTYRKEGELEGKEALDFAERYLVEMEVNPDTWEIKYRDPNTGEQWIMDYPHSEAQGGGSPRLRRSNNS